MTRQRPAPRATRTRKRPSERQQGSRKKSCGSSLDGKQCTRLSRLRQPQDLTLEGWQIELRRQFGAESKLGVRNLGDEPVFSEFEVTNPETGRSYRVAIRGEQLGDNFCSYPDYAVNTLGTCKHIESVLCRLRRIGKNRGDRAGFRGTPELPNGSFDPRISVFPWIPKP